MDEILGINSIVAVTCDSMLFGSITEAFTSWFCYFSIPLNLMIGSFRKIGENQFLVVRNDETHVRESTHVLKTAKNSRYGHFFLSRVFVKMII